MTPAELAKHADGIFSALEQARKAVQAAAAAVEDATMALYALERASERELTRNRRRRAPAGPSRARRR